MIAQEREQQQRRRAMEAKYPGENWRQIDKRLEIQDIERDEQKSAIYKQRRI